MKKKDFEYFIQKSTQKTLMSTKDADLETPLNEENELNDFHEPDSVKESNGDDENQKEDDEKKIQSENYRLAGRPPLKTLVILSIGPFISQLVSSMYGIVASMWVAKAEGDMGMAAVSLFTNLDNVGRAFGFFMNCSASQRISFLFGQKKKEETGQVICDLFRCCILSGMIVPALLLPVAKPLGKWFGADSETLQMGFDYLSILLGCSCISCFFLMFCGCLQAEGRTMIVSIAQISSFVMNMALFCPLFLLVFKLGTKGAALATVFSEGIPSIILFILYFCGKFSSKPKLSGLFKKFSPHTWKALGVGVSQLAANCSRSIPSILQRKFMGLITQNTDGMSFNDAMAGFNAVIRIAGLTDSFRMAISMALLPTASYSIAAELYDRFLYLGIHGCWLNLIWGCVISAITVCFPRYVAMMISSSEPYLAAAAPMIRNANIEAPVAWGRYICQSLLQALSCGLLASVYSIISSFVLNIAIFCLLYYTDKTNVPRMMYAYVISASISFVIGVLMLIKPLWGVYIKAKEKKLQSTELLAEESNETMESINSLNLEEKNSEKNINEAPSPDKEYGL